MAKDAPNELAWKGSAAKKILQKTLCDGEIPAMTAEMGALEVYNLRPEFQLFLYKRFQVRL
jgi:hypothetical protein